MKLLFLVLVLVLVYNLEIDQAQGTLLGKALYEAEYAGERGKMAADPMKIRPRADHKMKKEKRKKREQKKEVGEEKKLKAMSKLLTKIHDTSAKKGGIKSKKKSDRKKRFFALPVCTRKHLPQHGPGLGVCPKHVVKL
ncbi:unnamed protein product [Notodromas monacha]|uniref:Secreted protein n=1 Tax=Notodromas monacha TaxID=399045 RepID=A0A7R9BTG2_9CRUS|nr:unnamed protein product [Notodromas monacha]CAG0919814.1 unnamed protein product [Notodromas monacha]